MRTVIFIAIAAGACRPDPGTLDYPDRPDWFDTANPFLEGPDPWQEGEDRLSLGVFYEGGASDVLEVDDVTRHYYIFSNTYTQAPSEERIEGIESSAVALGNELWWGGGVIWDTPDDLSGWTTLHISLWSDDTIFDTMDVGMTGGGVETRVPLAPRGFAPDGQWHTLAIPLADFVAGGTNLSAVTGPLLLGGTSGAPGATVLVDNVYLTAE